MYDIKKRKRLFFAFIGFLLIAVAVLVIRYTSTTEVIVSNTEKNAILNFDYNDNSKHVSLSNEESRTITDMFNGKKSYFDLHISCGFYDYLTITFDDGLFKSVFYPACDGCYVVGYKGKIFYLSNSEGKQLDKILEKYGVKFPCL